jgi:hypothetical protein
LAWAQGAEGDRARGELFDLLTDPAPTVRIATAALAVALSEDPRTLARVLQSLKEETDIMAAYAKIVAILRLDPQEGRARIDAVASEAPSARPVIEAALKLRGAK